MTVDVSGFFHTEIKPQMYKYLDNMKQLWNSDSRRAGQCGSPSYFQYRYVWIL